MALLNLTVNDFYVDKKKSTTQTNDLILCIKGIPNLSFVMFHADGGKCKICDRIMPFIKQLPLMFQMCTFGLVNINRNMDLIMQSSKTITNITYVPYFIFYVNGRPAMRYEGARDEKSIAQFLNDTINKFKPTAQFSPTQQIQKPQPNVDVQTQGYEIPAYSIGVPFNLVCDEDMCYINYEDAYKKQDSKE